MEARSAPPGCDAKRTATIAAIDMMALFPPTGVSDVEALSAVAAEPRSPGSDRPWLMTNMIASADGATAVGGVSGPLGGPADLAVFMGLRSVTDAIIVGSQTVRAEHYRIPSGGSERARADRVERGQALVPLLVVITASLSLDLHLPIFADPGYRPLVATVEEAPSERRAELETVAEVVNFGRQQVDLGRLLSELHRRQVKVVLSEGGPSLNGQLIAADLVDEWNLTLSPILAAGNAKRPAHGDDLPHPSAPMKLSRVWQEDELLFCRWIRA